METIQVAIRIRPFLPYENETNTTIDVSSEDDRQIQIQKGKKKFQGFFDKYPTREIKTLTTIVI